MSGVTRAAFTRRNRVNSNHCHFCTIEPMCISAISFIPCTPPSRPDALRLTAVASRHDRFFFCPATGTLSHKELLNALNVRTDSHGTCSYSSHLISGPSG